MSPSPIPPPACARTHHRWELRPGLSHPFCTVWSCLDCIAVRWSHPPLDFGPGYRPVLVVQGEPMPLPPVDFGPGYTER
jgi:hypothetical protein